MISKNIFLIGLFLPLLIIPAFVYGTEPLTYLNMDSNFNDHGTLQNTVTPSGNIIYTQSPQGQAIKFTENNLIISDYNDYNFEYNEPFSVSLKIKTTDPYSIPISHASVTYGKGWNFEIYRGMPFFKIVSNWNADNAIVIGTENLITINDGSWHDIVWTYDGSGSASGVKLYVDGISVTVGYSGNKGQVTASIKNDVPLGIGATASMIGFCDCDIDEVKIHNYKLDESEIISTTDPTLKYKTLTEQITITNEIQNYKLWGEGSQPKNFLIFTENNLIQAKNTDSNQIEYSSTDFNQVADYALSHLGNDRTTQQKLEIQGDYTLTKKLRLDAYTWLIINGKLSYQENIPFQNSMIDTTKEFEKPNIRITNGTLNGNYNFFQSGIFIHNITNTIIENLTVQNFTHVGIYIKQGHNSKIINNDVSNIGLSGDPGVGSGIAWLGGTGNEICYNKVHDNKKGLLEAGIQIEPDDESGSPDLFRNSMICKNVIYGNGKVNSLVAGHGNNNIWEYNIIINGDITMNSATDEIIRNNYIWKGIKSIQGTRITDTGNIVIP